MSQIVADDRTGRRAREPRIDRTVLGWGLIVSGFVLVVVGWLAVSGRAEVAEQLPWSSLAVAGVVVTVVGGAQLAFRQAGTAVDHLERLEADVEALHEAAASGNGAAALGGAPATEVVAPPGARTYHRRRCALAVDKPSVRTFTRGAARDEGLSPCALCEPDANR